MRSMARAAPHAPHAAHIVHAAHAAAGGGGGNVSTTVETCRCVHRCTFQLFIRGRLFQCLVAFVTYLSMRYPAYKWRTPSV